MRLIVIILLAVVCFVGAIIGAMSFTGNLTPEGLDKLLGRQAPKTAEGAEKPDDVDPLLRQFEKKRQAIAKREAELAKREERVRLAEGQLSTTRAELAQLLKDLEEARQMEDAEREKRILTIADSFAAMKPENAAEALNRFSAEDAATILSKMDDARKRGKILDSLQSEEVANLMETYQDATS
jgi:flagellar motility protein MotE (MotC chaperone)